MNMGALRRMAMAMIAMAGMLLWAPADAVIKQGAINVAVYGFEYPQNSGAAVNTLEANGYNATQVMPSDIAAGLAGYDVLYVTHAFDGGGWSAAACAGMKNFLAAGKGVVLEWDSSLLAFTSLGPSIYVNATPQCALFAGTADRGTSVGFNTSITITDASSPLVAGLSSPFAMGAASDFMYQITGFDTAIWKVSATYSGWGVPNNMALMYGRYKDLGCIAIGTMAYGDDGYSLLLDMSSRILFLDLIGTVTPGANSCHGALQSTSFTIPATSPAALVILLAMLGGSGMLMRRRRSRRSA
jgi:hypothetical protein